MDRATNAVEKGEQQRVEMTIYQEVKDRELLELEIGQVDCEETCMASGDWRIEREALAVEDRSEIERRWVEL